MPNNFDQEFLNSQYHDQPERHRYGAAFFEPPTPTTITPLVTQAAAVGTSDAPARGDHTHGISALTIPAAATVAPTVITPYVTQAAAIGTSVKYAKEDHTHGITALPTYAIVTDAVSTGTLYTTTAAYIDGVIGNVVSVVNPHPVARLATIRSRARLDVYNIAAGVKQWFSFLYAAYTTDGSTPTAYFAISDAMGHPAMGAGLSDYAHLTGETAVAVPANATLKVRVKLYLYAVDVNIQFQYQSIYTTVIIL